MKLPACAIAVAIAAVGAGVALTARAQTTSTGSGQAYPAKPVRMIVPFPAGGATDIVARLLAQKLTETFGHQVLVDNRGGAGGTIGSDLAAKAPADGYTILMGTSSTHASRRACTRSCPTTRSGILRR